MERPGLISFANAVRDPLSWTTSTDLVSVEEPYG